MLLRNSDCQQVIRERNYHRENNAMIFHIVLSLPTRGIKIEIYQVYGSNRLFCCLSRISWEAFNSMYGHSLTYPESRNQQIIDKCHRFHVSVIISMLTLNNITKSHHFTIVIKRNSNFNWKYQESTIHEHKF